MGRRRLLLMPPLVLALMLAAPAGTAMANEVDYVAGQNTATETQIVAEQQDTSPPQPIAQTGTSEADLEDAPPNQPLNLIEVSLGIDRDLCSPTDPASCLFEPALPADPAAPVPGVVVTLRDIASFVPAGPGSEMEPGGWAVEDLPANFVAVASVQVVSGMLLGQPADVRFTPVGFRWLHSDGAVVESGTPGATWAVLGQREFSVTGTSHVYAESGEYTVALEVVLRAEYRFAGSGWRSIAGTLAVAGDPQRVLVGEFDTVLTNGDCNTNPSGPGC
ncbi:hypothetical protein [Agromyces laixinhei]|uniref:hypothetical protein n=1 Tax=Agromyces laixinhei TaxID=2585717 RepID=UPI0018DDB43E|nr:hypothetical protein [Agromyces laixinhei]